MFSFLRSRDAAVFVLGLFVGAAALQSLQAQVGSGAVVPVALTTYKIPLSPGKQVYYGVKTGSQFSMDDLNRGDIADVILLKNGSGMGSSITIDNSVAPGGEYKRTTPMVGAILAMVEIPWGTIKEQDCKDATQPGFRPGPFTLTASQTLCGRTADGAIFAFGIPQPMDPTEVVLIGFSTNVPAPKSAAPSPAVPAQNVVVSSVAAGEVMGMIRIAKMGTTVVDFTKGKYLDPREVTAKEPVPFDLLLTVYGGKLSLSTIVGTGYGTRQGAFIVQLPHVYKDLSYDACSPVANAAESAYASKSPTAYSAFPPSLMADLAKSICAKARGYVLKIGDYAVQQDGSITVQVTVWKPSADMADPKIPVEQPVAASSAPSSIAPAASSVAPTPVATATPIVGKMSFTGGKTSARLNLSTGAQEEAPKGHVEFASITKSVPQQSCRSVRSGFRSRTVCSTIYRTSTTLNLKALPSFTRLVAMPGKSFASMTVDDCVKAAENTKKAQPILHLDMSPTFVVCASSLIGPGLVHAKFDGGMNFTVWKP